MGKALLDGKLDFLSDFPPTVPFVLAGDKSTEIARSLSSRSTLCTPAPGDD